LKKSFADAVEDYTELWKRKNKNLEKTYKPGLCIRNMKSWLRYNLNAN